MAVFLAIGGLAFGLLRGFVFPTMPPGTVQEQRVSGGSSLIPQAEGAEVDSAALMPQSAPFVASINSGAVSSRLAENTNVLYGEGALKDPGQVQKTKSVAVVANVGSAPATSMVYQVKKGDTLKSLSAEFGIPMSTIVQFNPSVNFSSLSQGVSIVIPGQNDISLLAGQS